MKVGRFCIPGEIKRIPKSAKLQTIQGRQFSNRRGGMDPSGRAPARTYPGVRRCERSRGHVSTVSLTAQASRSSPRPKAAAFPPVGKE
jgi:hypothetical protein